MHFGGHKSNYVYILCACVCMHIYIYIYNTYKLVAGSLKSESVSFQLEGYKPTAPCTDIRAFPKHFVSVCLCWCWADAGSTGRCPGYCCLLHRWRLLLVQPASLSKLMAWQALAPGSGWDEGHGRSPSDALGRQSWFGGARAGCC